MLQLDLSSLRRALTSFDSALAVLSAAAASKLSEAQVNAVRAGVIQNFEFTYELSWKFIKRWVGRNVGRPEVEGVTRRQLFRLAAEHRLIDDVEQWMDYHEARNETAHTYDPKTADAVIGTAMKFAADARLLLDRLAARND